MKTKFTIGVLITCVLVCGTAGAFIFSGPPRYVAQAEFSINWNQVSLAKGDYNPIKARRKYDNTIAKFTASNEFVSLLCENYKIPSTQSASIVSRLRGNLRIVRVGTTNECDLYQVQFADINQGFALEAVNLLSRRLVDKVNQNTKIRNSVEALRSYQANVDVQKNDDVLRAGLASQLQQRNQGAATKLQGQLDENDVEKMVTGFKTLIHVVGLFSNPAKIEQHGVIVVD